MYLMGVIGRVETFVEESVALMQWNGLIHRRGSNTVTTLVESRSTEIVKLQGFEAYWPKERERNPGDQV